MKTYLSFVSLVLSLFISQSVSAKIWEGRNDWSIEWEIKYSAWIAEVAQDPDFFLKRKIPIDCADAAYDFRWIFARINNLKAAIKISKNQFFTNESDKFDHLPTASEWDQDQRFLKALKDIANYTKAELTLKDAYPVEISKASLTPGTLFVNAIRRQHVQVVARISDQSDRLPIGFVQSTSPQQLQSLIVIDYWDGKEPISEDEGFMKFRWPIKVNGKWSYVPENEMPYYSKSQYDNNLLTDWKLPYTRDADHPEIQTLPTFGTYVFFTLNPQLDPLAAIRHGFTEIVNKFKSRQELVELGYKHCRENKKGCPQGSDDYEGWSTPSRDKQIEELISQVAISIGNVRGIIANPQHEWNNFMQNTVIMKWNGKDVKALHLYIIWRNNLFSSDPNLSPDERWGFDKLDFENFKPK